MHYVYILKSIKFKNFIYAGFSSNIEKRLKKHNLGLVQSTKHFKPLELIFYEAYKSRRDAHRREKYFKTTKGRKTLKLMLSDSLA